MNKKISQLLLFLIGLVFSIGFDQWTKLLAVRQLKNNSPYVLLDGIFELYYSENRGAAFGILQGKQSFFFLIAVVVIVGVGFILYRMPANRRFLPFTFCLFLLISGAIGNLIDRMSNQFVVDFLYFKWIDFPIFNVADCYVVMATGLLLYLFLFYYSEEELEFLSFKKKKDSSEKLSDSLTPNNMPEKEQGREKNI